MHQLEVQVNLLSVKFRASSRMDYDIIEGFSYARYEAPIRDVPDVNRLFPDSNYRIVVTCT